MADIDLVYLWVNGNDPVWRAKHDKWFGTTTGNAGNCKGRYADNNELKYSLRSIELYAPWIRRIFIVTDHQVPEWLDTSNPKIQIVDHTEIMPPECLPCFNSCLIEHHLHNIPGLSERFLYANDDMLLNRPVAPATFYAADGLPIVRFVRHPFKKLVILIRTRILGKTMENYKQTLHNTALLVEKRFGIYFSGRTHHNIDAYLKSDYQRTRQMFEKEISETLCNHGRADNDIQRNLYSYVPIAEGRAHRVYVDRHTSFSLKIHKHKYYAIFQQYNPVFFCMNDSQFAYDEDRRLSTKFLSERFPNKSAFEK